MADKRQTAHKRTLLYGICRQSLTRGVAVAGVALALTAAPKVAHAKWTITPSASLQGVYTDNARLVATGEEGDYLLTAAGTINVLGELPRLESYIDYTLSYDQYGDVGVLSGERHDLTMRNKASIISEVLYFNVNGNVRERQTLGTTVTPTASRTFRGPQARITSINVGPEIKTMIGNSVALNADFQYSHVSYNDTSVGTNAIARTDDQIVRGNFNANNLTAANTLGWSLSGGAWQDDIDRQNFDVLGTINYLITPYMMAIARAGYDVADTDGDGVNDIETDHWRLGFEYRPSSRTSMRFEAGQRFDSSSYDAEINHVLGRSITLRGTYSHVLQTDQLGFATDSNAVLFDDLGNEIPAIDIIQNINNTAYVAKTGRLSISGETGQMSYFAKVYYREREFQNIPGEDSVVGGGVKISRNFGSQFYGTFSASMSSDDRPIPAQEVDRVRAGLGVGYRLSGTANAELTVATQKNEFGTGAEVSETSVSFSITKSW